MQHDTSPHRVLLAGKPVMAQCASLILAYSRFLFVQYYPRFTRFEARQFLLEAVRFMAGACPRCVIDNTSVIVVAGAGDEAVFAPEMVAFARTLGFAFRAHQVNHPDRKGRVERPFAYVEGNFLAGREFHDFADLNRQALAWCQEIANAKPKRALGVAPLAAYAVEKLSLQPLPDGAAAGLSGGRCPSGKAAKRPGQGRRKPPAIKYLHFQLTFHAQIGYGAAHAHAPEGPTPADFRRRSRLHPPVDRRSSGVESQDRVEAGV
jgi:hypothetical protein